LPKDDDNVVHVYLKAGSTFSPQMLTRNFYITSSCGVCGKASLNALRIRGIEPLVSSDFHVPATVLLGLGESLRGSQILFKRTGGLHAAALFDVQGGLLDIREDVGRHNAMDKLLGRRLLDGNMPIDKHVAFLSGRASWELMQKALVARIPVVVAVGAPSSLAIDLANDFNITLAGFAREGQFNVYAGAERIDFAS
jgi:FdhD protein